MLVRNIGFATVRMNFKILQYIDIHIFSDETIIKFLKIILKVGKSTYFNLRRKIYKYLSRRLYIVKKTWREC